MQKFKTPLQIGLYWGIGYILIMMLLYLIHHEWMHSWWFGMLIFLAGVGVMIYSGIRQRIELGGYISWKDAMSAAWASSIVYTLLSVFFSMVLYNWIDPGLQEEIRVAQIKAMESMRGMMGEEAFEEAMTAIEENNSFSPVNMLKGIPMSLLFNFILASLAALVVMRKDSGDAGSFKDKL
jgi:riboflavin transporter FmnP